MIPAWALPLILSSPPWSYGGFAGEPGPPSAEKEKKDYPAIPVPPNDTAIPIPFPKQELPERFLPQSKGSKPVEKLKEALQPKPDLKPVLKPVLKPKVKGVSRPVREVSEAELKGWYPLLGEPGVEGYGALDAAGRVVVEERRVLIVPVPVWGWPSSAGGFFCPGGSCR